MWIYEQALRQLAAGQDTVLCWVTDKSGMTPRGAGAHMLVCTDGHAFGTVGGGTMEAQARALALELLQTKSGTGRVQVLWTNCVDHCGGALTIAFLYFSAEDGKTEQFFRAWQEAWEAYRELWIVIGSADGAVLGCGTERAAGELTPEKLCAAGTEVPEHLVWYEDRLCRGGRVVVFGSGHVAKGTVPVLAHIGLRCLIADNRPEAELREDFPQAEAVLSLSPEEQEKMELFPSDHILILGSGLPASLALTARALTSGCRYIGALGSRKKAGVIAGNLQKMGYTPEQISCLHMPVGLSVHAETPEEIGVSIAAEILSLR